MTIKEDKKKDRQINIMAAGVFESIKRHLKLDDKIKPIKVEKITQLELLSATFNDRRRLLIEDAMELGVNIYVNSIHGEENNRIIDNPFSTMYWITSKYNGRIVA